MDTITRGIIKTAAVGALASAVATAGLTLAAEGAVDPAHNVLVLKDESIVEADGFAPDAPVQAVVRRNGVVVGSVATNANANGEFVVNHDFCWDDFTPQILPGDVVEMTSGGITDTVRVSNVKAVRGPTIARRGSGVGTIKGRVARRVPLGNLMVEARSNDPIRFRPLAPDTVDGVRGTISYDRRTGGAFTATFRGMSRQQEQAFLSAGEYTVSQGPAGNEMTVASDAEPAAGPGCALDAPVWGHAVTGLSRAVINRTSQRAELRVRGTTMDATGVSVSLRDGDGTLVTRRADVNGTGLQTWNATIAPRALRSLSGNIRVFARYATTNGTVGGATKSLLKDTVAPRRPSASPRGGTFSRRQAVRLRAGRGTSIRYTLGGRGAPAPTARRGNLYRGNPVRITSTQTLKAVAIDRAGNVSRLMSKSYVIR